MKKIYSSIMLLVLCLLGACSEDSLDDLKGTYDMDRYVFTRITEQSVEQIGKGIKVLHITLADEAGNQWALRIGSSNWILQEATYICTEEITADKQYSAVLQGSGSSGQVTGGNLEVTRIEDTYFMVGLLEISNGTQVNCEYKGTISFEVGEDDPEASGYTVALTTSDVITYDETGTPVFHSGITKYTFTVTDPDGADAALFDAIHAEGVETTALAGTYTIQGNAAEAWLMDNGWVFPEWGMAGGSYYVDGQGIKQYITSGTITVATAEDADGEMLYSFSGSGLGTVTAAGATGTGAFSILFATIK